MGAADVKVVWTCLFTPTCTKTQLKATYLLIQSLEEIFLVLVQSVRDTHSLGDLPKFFYPVLKNGTKKQLAKLVAPTASGCNLLPSLT